MNSFQGGGHDLVSDTTRWNFILDRSKLFLYAQIGGSSSNIDEQASASVRCYPNPAGDWIQIEPIAQSGWEDAALQYAVFDLFGRLVRPFSTLDVQNKIYLGDLSDGQYLLSICQKHKTSFHRIIKK